MLAQDLCYLSIADAAAGFRSKAFSPVEVTASLLARIEAVDPKINSYLTVTSELAMLHARQAETDFMQGNARGPLHGIPVALKDLYATAGIRTTAHSQVLIDWVPAEDATATALLKAAGCVLLGKLAMHEFAFGGPAFDTPFPPARNPWNPDYIPGGSSSGSGAALAAGLCLGALGSDTGGSIRGPASFCGIVGLKPTYGRVSRAGVVPLSWSLDHAGPMTRTVEDCALMLQTIAGYDPKDPASANVPVPDYTAGLKDGVKGLRLGVPRSWFSEGDGVHPETLAALEVFQGLGATVVEVDGAPFMAARNANSIILIAEAYAYHEQNLKERPQDFGSSVRSRFRQGAFFSAADYIQAQRARTAITAQITALFANVDAFVMPTSAAPATNFAEFNPDGMYRQPSFTNPFNLTGLPAVSVPCGFSTLGLPIGMQIAGRAFDETTVLRIAWAYEQATEWRLRKPAI